MSYPTLAHETVVERKGDDATDRQANVVLHPAPVTPPAPVVTEEDEVEADADDAAAVSHDSA